MTCIIWEKEHELGIKEIDEQHKKLIEIMNHLCETINSGKENYFVDEILDDLRDYAMAHFQTEEKYFIEFKYEDAEEHRKQHNKFFSALKLFKRDLDIGEEHVAKELTEFLENWLFNHMMKYDKKYVECFHKNGLY
ncbi:hemerythrin family protein [Candidatus Peregrinibacteria bacterium]|nr:hemerythrin family protein [Candidatus Peregrinibacteria bacterium]